MKKHTSYSYAKIAGMFLAAVLAFGAHAARASAARLYVDVSSTVYGVGDTFLVPVKLDAEGSDINAVSGDLLFPDSIVSVTGVRDNDSPITNWVDAPVVSGNSVTFSGIIPGGFTGLLSASTAGKAPATILWLAVTGDAAGTGMFTFADAHAYANDGDGTEVAIDAPSSSITIKDTGTNASIDNSSDDAPPLPFTPVVTQSPLIYNDEYVLLFSTTDKGSGIAYYEVSEGFGPWVRATSPYLLNDQSLRSTIRVRAVDNAGNERDESVGTPPIIPGSVFAIVLIALAVLLYLLYYRYNKMRRARESRED